MVMGSRVMSPDGAARTEAGAQRETKDEGFQVSHFFVLLSLMAATVAVVMARPSAPENLILVSLTIGAAGLAAVGFYRTIAPLVDPRADDEREPLSGRLRADLEREKALTLRSIKELEFDRAMGKVSEEDFAQMAGRLRARALGIMRHLEAGQSVYRQEIEKELAARLQNAPGLKTRPTADRHADTDPRRADIQVRQATDTRRTDTDSRRADLQVRQTEDVVCDCGAKNDFDARFCKSCGARLAESAT